MWLPVAAEKAHDTKPSPTASHRKGHPKGQAKTSAAAGSRKAGAAGPARGGASKWKSSRAAGLKGSRSLRAAKWSSAPAAPATPRTPSAERYSEIQQALANKGYLPGPPTGTWGPDSVAALKRFQEDQKLPSDGKLGARSLTALGLGPGAENSIPLAPPSRFPDQAQ